MSEAKPEGAIDVVEFPFAGVTIKPSHDQFTAWSMSAGDTPLAEWLADVADNAAVALSYTERTWPVVITLKHPIDLGPQHITQLELRRGRVGDIKGMKLGGELATDQLVTMAARMSGQSTHVIERLDAEDAGEVMAIVLDFYGRCLGAGRTRSR